MYILRVSCYSERDAIKLKTNFQSYCNRYLHMYGTRTTSRVDIIRSSSKVFKISCDMFLGQINKIINIMCFDYNIRVNYSIEKLATWMYSPRR